MYLLDVGTCVAATRQVGAVHLRCRQHAGNLCVSVVTVTELDLWVTRPRTPFRHQRTYLSLLQQLTLLNVDEPIAVAAARIGNHLLQQKRRLVIADLLVAATAQVHGQTLVTIGPSVFANVPGLTVVDWQIP